MAFTAPLAALRGLVRAARDDASLSAGGGAARPTVDLALSKETLIEQFKGAIYKLADGSFRSAAAPYVKHASSGIELVLSGHDVGSARRYAKMSWCDDTDAGIATIIFNVLDPHKVLVGGRESSVTPCRGSSDAFAALSIASGTSQPYELSIPDALAIITLPEGSSGGHPQEEDWVPQQPASVATPITPLGFKADGFGTEDSFPRLFLRVLGISHDQDGLIDFRSVAELLGALSGEPQGADSLIRAMSSDFDDSTRISSIASAVSSLQVAGLSTVLTDLAVEAKEMAASTPAAVPTNRFAIMGDFMRSALTEVPEPAVR
jgi:hypothetical protein